MRLLCYKDQLNKSQLCIILLLLAWDHETVGFFSKFDQHYILSNPQ